MSTAKPTLRAPLYATRAGIVGTILAITVAAACIRLGFWQLDRLEQRRARNALIEERLSAPVVTLTTAPVDTAGLPYRRVELRGEYLIDDSFVLASRAYRGTPGVHVITPLRLDRGDIVLVNRGWLPSPDAATVDLSAYDVAGPVRLTGLARSFFPKRRGDAPASARRPGNQPIRGDEAATGRGDAGSHAAGAADTGRTRAAPVHFHPDAATIRTALPYPVADFIIQALPEPGAPDRPVRLPAPELDEGPHLGYAIQWFSFATIALVGWLVLAIRKGEIGGGSTDPRAPR